jgi:aminoglycoside phosphotransferase family enzyme
VVIDCLEFNARLRQVDPLDELSFLALECDLAGAPWIGPRLLERCTAALRDPAPAELLTLYRAYRALLRARLAMAHLLDPQPRTPQRWVPLAQRYVALALQALAADDGAQRTVNPAMSRGSR